MNALWGGSSLCLSTCSMKSGIRVYTKNWQMSFILVFISNWSSLFFLWFNIQKKWYMTYTYYGCPLHLQLILEYFSVWWIFNNKKLFELTMWFNGWKECCSQEIWYYDIDFFNITYNSGRDVWYSYCARETEM